jgi:hypothetical protein
MSSFFVNFIFFYFAAVLTGTLVGYLADFASLFLQTQQQKNKNVDVNSARFARIWRFDGSLLVEFTVVKILEQRGEFAFWQYSLIAAKKYSFCVTF